MCSKQKILSERIIKLFPNLNISDDMFERFLRYYDILIERNQYMNLTAVTEFYEVVEKHFLDSIMLALYMDLDRGLKIIDVGTGAGFPGIPLKILFPQIDMLLVDSLNKRVNFLNEIISELNLNRISAIHGRAEELAKEKEYRGRFDVCVSRAVANLSVLSEYCIPFVKVSGMFVSYKSSDIEYEISESVRAIDILGGNLEKVEKFHLPETSYKRSLIFIKKRKDTPKKYPRKPGMPAKQPLK